MSMTFHPTRKKASGDTPPNERPRGNPFRDLSLWVLLASNGVTILLAMTQNWNVLPLMWIYWFQNIVIGFFNFLRIRQLKEFSTEGFSINGRPAQPTQETKNHVARFFLMHYGVFHLGYLVFLLTFSQTGWLGSAGENGFSSADVIYVVLAALLFLGNHVFSYFYNRPRDTGRPKIGTLMFYPYARIIPMHFTILLGAFLGGGLLLFLSLKTLADVIMHAVEHRVLLRRRAQGADETAKSGQETEGNRSTEWEQETAGGESFAKQEAVGSGSTESEQGAEGGKLPEKQVAAEKKPGSDRLILLIIFAVLPFVLLGLCKVAWDDGNGEGIIGCFIAFVFSIIGFIRALVNFVRKRD